MLALCLLAGALPLSASAAEYSGTCGTNLKWEIADGTLTISGTGAMNDFPAGYSQVPWYKYRDHFTKAQVQSGVTTVGENAFVWMDPNDGGHLAGYFDEHWRLCFSMVRQFGRASPSRQGSPLLGKTLSPNVIP